MKQINLKMENVINWFEIPAVDFNRAVSFYGSILGLEIRNTEMFGTKIGFFPTDGKNVSGAIVEGDDYKPSSEGGVVAYLNGGSDLQHVLDKVEDNHGKVIVPKTQISPELGYFGMFIDSEGNKMAVQSAN
jgi:hypothetical protein